jgi:hypothetical protein
VPKNKDIDHAIQRKLTEGQRVKIHADIHLYLRSGTQIIWADYRLLTGRKRRSTGETDVGKAKIAARRALRSLQERVQRGESLSNHGPTVGNLLTAYRAVVQTQIDAGDAGSKPMRSVIDNLMTVWKAVPIGALSGNLFLAKQDERAAQGGKKKIRTYQRGGVRVKNVVELKKPSIGTLAREKTAFIAALEWGRQQPRPWLTRAMVDEVRAARKHGRHGKAKRDIDRARMALTQDQIDTLLRHFEDQQERENKRVDRQGARVPRRNYERRLMSILVRLMLCSGMRPGTEINEIVWEDIRQEVTPDGFSIIVITKCGNGKTGSRRVNCLPESIVVIRDLRALLQEFGHPTAGRSPLFPNRRSGSAVSDFNRSFKSALAKIGLPEARREQPLYCLRHTYITRQLLNKISIDVLAINCGTSVEMIERFYSGVKSEQIADHLIPKVQSKQTAHTQITRPTMYNPTNLTFDPSSGKLVYEIK